MSLHSETYIYAPVEVGAVCCACLGAQSTVFGDGFLVYHTMCPVSVFNINSAPHIGYLDNTRGVSTEVGSLNEVAPAPKAGYY